jgi:hypothetical protein
MPAAAFERVEAAANRCAAPRDRRGCRAASCDWPRSRRELSCFEEVDLEQLAIELACIGGEQTLRLLGDFWRGGGRVRDRVDGGGEACRVAGFELGHHAFDLRHEIGVVDEVGRRP